jgi:hypothetical protein
MGRLAFSTSAFYRRLRMSKKARVFLIVEGKNHDQWYYESLCNANRELKSAGVISYTSNSIGREFGNENLQGKAGVLAVHDHLKSIGGLTSGSGPNKKTVMCCLDADHDRILNKIRRSRHITYTQLPDVEAHLIDDCDPVELISRLLSAPDRSMASTMASLGDWRLTFALESREWFILCHTCFELSIPRGPSPDTPPPLKTNAGYRVDESLVRSLAGKISKADSVTRIRSARQKVEYRIDRLFLAGRHLRLLKGKWLAGRLSSLLIAQAKKHNLDTSCGKDAVMACAKGLARHDSAWARYFQGRILANLK